MKLAKFLPNRLGGYPGCNRNVALDQLLCCVSGFYPSSLPMPVSCGCRGIRNRFYCISPKKIKRFNITALILI